MKLTLVVPGRSTGATQAVFGDDGGLLPGAPTAPRVRGTLHTAPETACRETARLLAATAEETADPIVLADLRGPGFGAWHGLALSEVLERDPVGLAEWLRDPSATPHGGESLAGHLERVGALLDTRPWPASGAVLVVSALTARAACVHALAAGPESLFHLDLGPSTLARLSLNGETWRLQSISPLRGQTAD